jgi:hypothetical protein
VIKKTKAEYDMYILGRKLTDVNIADFAAPGWKSGTLSYDYTPQRLILTDVEIDASSTNTDAYGIEFNKMELNFKGTSHIKTGNKAALYLKSNVTITSGENAKAYISSEKGAACEVIANRTLTLKAGYRSKFEFVGQEYGLLGASTSTLDMQVAGYEVSYRMFSWNENLPAFTVGKFVNESGNGFDFKDNGGAYTAAYWDASKKMPLRNGGECARAIDLVDIRSKYDASIGGKQFNDVNKYGMAAPFFYKNGDRQATYDQTTNTITLNNAYIDFFLTKNDAAYGIDFSSNGTLIVNGSNVVRTRKTATVLNAYGNLTITSATKDFKSTLELGCDEGGVGIDLHYPNNNNNNWVSIQDRVYVKLSCFAAKKGIACAYWNLFCGTLKVDDATVDVISGGIGPLNSVSLTDCAFLFPDGASFDTKQHAVVDANGDVLTTKLQIRSINDDVSPVYIEGIPINGEGYFPDGNFRRYVSANFDTNKNGYLSDSERNSVTFIDVQGLSIHRMTGIEWFPNLQSLYCSDNQIEELDVSKLEKLVVIYCHHNEINGENMDAFVNSLPVSDNGRLYVCDLDDVEGNYITPEQVAIAKGKHWSVRAQKDGKFVDFDGMTPGDVNLDKKVNVGDIMAVINTMSANKNASIADVNLDKKVNVGDIMAVINIMASK